jgi:hypothetical protein
MIPTSAQLALLRTRPHRTNLWLSIYKPDIVFAARVNNGSAAKGMRTTAYDTLVSGSAGYIENGMTCYVGTTPQGRDKGKIRCKGITGSTIYFAENDYINWADDDYLTVMRFIEPWTVYPRMITGSNDTIIMYKDWDIEYTNQNDVLGSFINMGCHYAGFREAGTGTVYYTASGTYNLRGDDLSYEWFFEGAVTTGSTLHTPGYIAYNAPGYYMTRLIVTATGTAGQTTDVSYREVSIYDRPENGTKVPVLQWRMDGIDGSRDQGGYSAKITVWENANEINIVEGALVVLFADDWYGATKQSIGGNSLNRDSIVFCGYIMDGSIEYNWRDKSVSFEVASPTEKMKSLPGLSMYVQSSVDPSNEPNINEDVPSAWTALLDMDCKRALYYYLRWHSTALMTNDFEFVGTDQKIKYFDPDSASLYDIINGFMENTLLGSFVCDRQGKFWSEINIKAIDNATGTMPTNAELQKNDWMNAIGIDEVNTNDLYYLEMGGYQYSGATTGTSTPFLACAPGDNLDVEGSSDLHEGLALESQNQLNTLVGNVFAYRNSRYPTVDVDLAGDYRIHDIAPQECVPLTTESNDTNRGVVWTGKRFHPIAMSLSYDGRTEALLSNITLHEVTQGFPGDTIIIPPEPPDDGDYVPDYDPIDIPIISIPTGTPRPPDIGTDHPGTVFVVGCEYVGTGTWSLDTDENHYQLTLAKTTNFTSTSPTWTKVLPSNVSGTFLHDAGQEEFDCCFNPISPGVQCWWLTGWGVWEISGLQHTTGTFATCILDREDAATLIGVTGSSVRFRRVVASPVEDGLSTIYVILEGTYSPPGWGTVLPSYVVTCNRNAGGAWSTLGEISPGAGVRGSRGVGIGLGGYNKNFWGVGGGAGKLFVTLDGGGILGCVLDTADYYAPKDVFIPRPATNVMYVVDGDPEKVYKSISYGASGTFSDITPYISGAYWGCYNGTQWRTCIITSTNIDASKINALLETDDVPMTYGNQNQAILSSDDGGTNWSLKRILGGATTTVMSKNRGLVTHPGDINKLYFSGYYGSGYEIVQSSDRGATLVDKSGNWVTVFGCAPTKRVTCGTPGHGGFIFPVFT